MAGYGFEAAPRVVANKAKYSKRAGGADEEQSEAGGAAFNTMFDKRVFRGNTHAMHLVKKMGTALSPQQKDNMRVEAEKERKKVEMIKQQLVAFSSNRAKQTPYDLRPGPPARIEVDLEPFLTEQIAEPVQEEAEEVQCDEFVERPATPEYVPKKRGMDNWTQVEDYDLFDYDAEVAPILNVLVAKTLEQAQLEVEEDAEIASIRTFKKDYAGRRAEERDQWAQAVKEEIRLLKEKNVMRERARKVKDQQVATVAKVQELALAKQYLRGLFKNVVLGLEAQSFWRNGKQDALDVSYRDYLEAGVAARLVAREASAHLMAEVAGGVLASAAKQRDEVEQARAVKLQEREKARLIEHPSRRWVFFEFRNPFAQLVETQFAKRLSLFLKGELVKWEQEHTIRVKDFQEKIDAQEFDEPKEVPTTQDPVTVAQPAALLNVARFKSIGLATAVNPFFPTH